MNAMSYPFKIKWLPLTLACYIDSHGVINGLLHLGNSPQSITVGISNSDSTMQYATIRDEHYKFF